MAAAVSPGMQRVLVTVAGPDTPGITAMLTGVIAECGVALLDIEQVVVQRQLTLCLLLGVGASPALGDQVLKELLFAAKRMGLEMGFRVLDPEDLTPPDVQQWAVTAIGDDLDARGIHAVATVLAAHGTNIERISALSDGRLASVEVIISMPRAVDADHVAQARDLRRALIEATGHVNVDIAVQRETLTRRSKRLVAMDMDSTLIKIEVIDELARLHGVAAEVSELTRRAMAGELDYEQSLRQRVGLLEGLEHERVLALARDLPITDGARELLRVLRLLGYKTAVISGGFTFAANALKVRNGRLTGRVLDPVVTPQRKADLLDLIAQGEGIDIAQTIAIGDGANDLPMLERAGLGIAFHAKAKLRAAADTAVSQGGLDRILYLLGLTAREVKEVLARR